MSGDLSGEITAIATVALAAFAIVTAVFAILAFRKQSSEVQEQARMLEVQSSRLEEQRKVNVRQIEVLELQAIELRDSTAVRKRAQAARVYITQEPEWNLADMDRHPGSEGSGPRVTVTMVNSSEQPIYDAEIRWQLGYRRARRAQPRAGRHRRSRRHGEQDAFLPVRCRHGRHRGRRQVHRRQQHQMATAAGRPPRRVPPGLKTRARGATIRFRPFPSAITTSRTATIG